MAAQRSFSLMGELERAVTGASPERRLEMLRRVTDQFLSDADRLSEEQIGVFDDVLASLTKTIENKALARLSADLAHLDNAPRETIRTLAFNEDVSVAGPVLAKSTRLHDHDLVSIASTRGRQHLMAISQRPTINESVTDVLLQRDDSSVTRALAKNTGARFSDNGLATIVRRAEGDDALVDELCRRRDIPPARLEQLLLQATDTVRARMLASAPSEVRQRIRSAILTVAGELGRDIAGSQTSSHQDSIVHMLNQSGQLNEAAVKRFAQIGQFEELDLALALLCSVAVGTIEPLTSNGNRDGIVLACRAARLSWETTKLILAARSSVRPMPEADVLKAKEGYDQLSPAAAQRTLRFMQAKSALRNTG